MGARTCTLLTIESFMKEYPWACIFPTFSYETAKASR